MDRHVSHFNIVRHQSLLLPGGGGGGWRGHRIFAGLKIRSTINQQQQLVQLFENQESECEQLCLLDNVEFDSVLCSDFIIH